MPGPRAKEVIESIAANVHRQRLKLGLTQEQLAEVANLAPRSIQRLERAKQDLGVSALVAVADALGLLPAALLKPAKMKAPRPGRPASRKSTRRKAAKPSPLP